MSKFGRNLLNTLFFAALLQGLQASEKPNIIFILVDDMGWSDLGAYGGEIETPNIDSLAAQGIRFTQFYNTAKCFPSRACLLTGTYAQQSQMSDQAAVIKNSVTLGEVLRSAGYRTYASGKHHGTENLYDRGFDHYYGLRDGCCNFWNPGLQREGEPEPGRKRTRVWCDDAKTYEPFTPTDKSFYTTDAFTEKALTWLDEDELENQPFFLYLAYNAPHYPLHAWPEDIAKYKGKYDEGYQAIRQARYERMATLGLIDPDKTPLLPMSNDSWQNLNGIELEKEKLRMEIYAAMLDRVDQNIGRVLEKLRHQGKLDNTLIMFASDNGGCAEESGATTYSTQIEDFGKVASFETVGESWATVQNTPFRYWKNYSHEGGICTPFIVSWPDHIKKPGSLNDEPGHFIDVMSTLVELTGAEYPSEYNGGYITPMQGTSLLPALANETLERKEPIYWDWSNGGGVRNGNFKAVFWNGKWELHDMSKNRNETNDLAKELPQKLDRLKGKWQDWKKATARENRSSDEIQ